MGQKWGEYAKATKANPLVTCGEDWLLISYAHLQL
jgi:hypothetical protein